MSDLPISFVGLNRWPTNIEVVECVVDDRVIDLHNACTLIEVVTTCSPRLELWFRLMIDGSGDRVELGFLEVKNLGFRQDDAAASPAAWLPEEVSTFGGVEYSSGRFAVETIVGDFGFPPVAP